MLGYIYFQNEKGAMSAVQGDEVKGSFSVGMIIGQIGFGSLGDALGRHRVYGKECLFAIFGTLMVILMPWRGLSHTGLVAWLSVFRCLTGIGTGGGELSATSSSRRIILTAKSRLSHDIHVVC